jgi:hypothetical protein
MKKIIFILGLMFQISSLAFASNLCSDVLKNKIKEKIKFLITPDDNDACAYDNLEFDDLFFKDKIKDVEYLIIFLANSCSLKSINNFENINDMLENSTAKDAEDLDILTCNKIIETVQNELISLRMYLNRPVKIEYDPFNGEARSVSWQDGGFRHILHLQDLILHNRYDIWKKGDVSILPFHHLKSVKRSRKYNFIGKLIRETEKGNFKTFPFSVQKIINDLIK